MSEIKFDGDRLAADIAVHLNNAQSSLMAGRGDLLVSGFVSAVTAYALADEAMLFVDRASGDYERFKALRSSAKAVGAGYRAKYALAIRVGENGALEIVQDEPKSVQPTNIRHIPAKNHNHNPSGANKRLTKEQQTDLIKMILAGPKSGETTSEFVAELARAFGISKWTVNYYQNKAHDTVKNSSSAR